MLTKVRHFLEMIRFSHSVFALPFAVFAAVLAWVVPSQSGDMITWPRIGRDLLGIVVCMVFARSAAMAFNRLADRRIDGLNPRTAVRHLPAGVLSVKGVVVFLIFSALGFVAGTFLFLPNQLPMILCIPVMVFLCLYSYVKRFSALAHFWLGASLMMTPVAAWIAIRGESLLAHPSDVVPAVWLGMGVMWWVSGFDIIYACQDADFDVKAKLHSVPAALGVAKSLRLAAICHLIMVLTMAGLPFSYILGGPAVPLGVVFLAGVCFVGGLLIYEHRLVKPDDLARVNIAFFHVNAVVSLGLCTLGVIDAIF